MQRSCLNDLLLIFNLWCQLIGFIFFEWVISLCWNFQDNLISYIPFIWKSFIKIWNGSCAALVHLTWNDYCIIGRPPSHWHLLYIKSVPPSTHVHPGAPPSPFHFRPQCIFSLKEEIEKESLEHFKQVIKICPNRGHIFMNKLMNTWAAMLKTSTGSRVKVNKNIRAKCR